MKKAPPTASLIRFHLMAVAGALLLAPVASEAGTPAKAPISPVVETPAPSPLHALLKLDFSTDYITPRGLHVENQGLVFQPLFLLFYTPYASSEGFINDVTITGGVWSSFHSEESGADPGHWNEFDPIAGLAIKFADAWKFEVNYTAFKSMTDSFETSQHLELKLSYDDSKLTGSKIFSINPYVAYWQELDKKATVVFNTETSEESYYFTLGINPTLNFTAVKFEFPTYVNLVDDDFYQTFEGLPGGDGAAVFRTGVQASVPLSFIPKSMGFWSLYAGVRFYFLDNEGLLDGNQVLSEASRDDTLFQVYGGISIFF